MASSSNSPQDEISATKESSGLTLIEETYHSTIESRQLRGAKVVIKTCRNINDERAPARWRNEVRVLQRVGVHENVAQIFASDADRLAITLRFEPGRSLDRHVDARMTSTLSAPDCRALATQMAGALSYLHALYITHDDVKPENIMWWEGAGAPHPGSPSRPPHAVLIDFGAALDFAAVPAGESSSLFTLSGTPPYAPPEFLQRRKVHAAGDVWALGIVLLFALGRIPLPSGNWLLPAVFEDGAPLREMLAWLAEIDRLRRGLAGSEEALVAEMLEGNPEARISSSELVRRLSS